MKYTNFHADRFFRQVDNALVSVKRILDTSRNPCLAHEFDDNHVYDDKYALATLLTNTSLVAHMNVLEHMGLTAEHLERIGKWVLDEKQSVTMRYQAVQSCKFVEQKEVKVVTDNQSFEYHQEIEKSGRFFGKNKESLAIKNRVVTKVKEYHWKVVLKHKLILFAGVAPNTTTTTTSGTSSQEDASEDTDNTITLQSRDASTILCICGTDKPPFVNVTKHDPIDVDMTWLFQQISPSKKICTFTIDRSNETKCRTPRRNEQIDQAIVFHKGLCRFAERLHTFLRLKVEMDILGRHAPAQPTHPTPALGNDHKQPPRLSSLSANNFLCPILPLFEKSRIESKTKMMTCSSRSSSSAGKAEPLVTLSGVEDDNSPVLSMDDIEKFLAEQIRTMEAALQTIGQQFPAPVTPSDATSSTNCMLSTVEATLYLLSLHLMQLAEQYEDAVEYIEYMLQQQLVAAIGKEIRPQDFDEYMSFHYKHKFYSPNFAPGPFCFAIRRPGHYPDGILTIEKRNYNNDNNNNQLEPIETFTRKIVATDETPPIRIPLNAATTVEMTGDRYLHGWVKHRFQGNSSFNGNYVLGARARQFSCFLVMVGTMAGPDQMDPKDAIILQNKDEVLIPLLLNELPTAKDFKDAISSLSPEQQRFAKAFRGMQLESSVFGVCVVQLKPQLEDLLELPRGALTKEMQLTQDLLSLFIDYQIPSDLLTFEGNADESKAQKIASVKEYTKSVLDVIQGAKDKQLEQAKQKANMGVARYVNAVCDDSNDPLIELEESLKACVAESASPCQELIFCKKSKNRGVPKMKMSTGGFLGAAASAPRSGMLDSVPPPAASAFYSFGAPSNAPGFDFSRNLLLTEDNDCSGPGFDFSSVPRDGGLGQDISAVVEPPTSVPLPQTIVNNAIGDDTVVDFTLIPKQLDAQFEAHDKDNSLRATIIKTENVWTRRRQENLLTKVTEQVLEETEIKSEKDKAFDLLDALSRSGSLPLAYSELHVVVAVTHSFENDIMGTVIQDNINPIEKVEKSSCMVASTIYGVAPRALLRSEDHVARLQGAFPALFDGEA